MSESGRCSNCGAMRPAGFLHGLCPACLLRAGAAGRNGDSAGASATASAGWRGGGSDGRRDPSRSIGPGGPGPSFGIGTKLGERFTLDAELGRGGMGTVYRASDHLLGRRVAIKMLRGTRTENEAGQIRLEAQILARLAHDRIVRLYDFGEADGTCFLIMEEVDGPSFADRWPDLPLSDRLRVCGQVAQALHFAHGQGVIHRDVKPGNVLLTSGDEAKLSDFGLSLAAGDRGDRDGSIRGTPLYMSPEQAQGAALSHRSDLYSLGVMLYECTTGEPPFVGDIASLLERHRAASPVPPRNRNPEIWSTLDGLIRSLLAKSPSRRPGSGNVVALELFEEAERAERLRRINPGVRRSGPGGQADAIPPGTPSASGWKPGAASANGARHSDREGMDSSPACSAPSMPIHPEPGDADPGSSPPRKPAGSSRVRRSTAAAAADHPVARRMLQETTATPILLSPEERYLCGHYLAYLLGGARRQGLLLGRPLDARNADRARFLLAMAWLSCVGPTDESIELAKALLDDRPDVRAALTPVVVMKYLASRDTPARHQWFRRVRSRLKDASAYARRKMLDSKGALNPGLMPRSLDDLRLIAPPRGVMDAHRVSLWNRVAEVWQEEDEFRKAVLRYATGSDARDSASVDLWPEVVYPLIEHTHWQRTFRPRLEAIWDYVVGQILKAPVPGVRLDRMMIVAIPLDVSEQLDRDLATFVEDPELREGETSSDEIQTPDDGWLEAEREGEGRKSERLPFYCDARIPREEAPADDDAPPDRTLVPLWPPDPFVFTQASLRDMWEEAMNLRHTSAGPRFLHRNVPVGPYRFAVAPTGVGRSELRAGAAIRAILQGLSTGKEIEVFTPSTIAANAASRTAIAIWLYENQSVLLAYLDFQSRDRYILWHAPKAHQFNLKYPEEVRTVLPTVNLEIPDRFDGLLAGR
ncbi:Serine/threonine-protein kinase PknB [Aquisphaera giovannonii]|uniref:Serine/threonine-protein kinase PknB n=1 Tax=Aquisphaera giovannonii TaxID=406548 RepID=A0A5B9VWT9_9BACT|nr:serine/threonine-protein kinase [Aquisphaera giovannonii]QEH32245.1 Serine/threonine-protein kinase PknB [Aquisphaera giovannonii]